MRYFLVIDAGTGSGRAVLFDETGRQVALSQREWVHSDKSGAEGAIDFDTELSWRIIKDLVREVMASARVLPSDIKAISATSMREGIVLYDETGAEIWACSNVDARASEEARLLQAMGIEQRVYDLTGQTFALSAPPRMLWVERNAPDIFERVASFGMISDWIVYRLSGKHCFEPSNGSTSALMDTFRREWSDELFRILDLPTSIRPPMYEPGTVIGDIDRSVADELGLDPHTLIVVGGGDAQLGVMGVGAVHRGDAVVLGGSFWQQEINTDTPVPHPSARVRVNAHAIPGIWQYEGISFRLGLVMRWFRDGFCHREKDIARQLGVSAYSLLSEMAQVVPAGSYGVTPIHSDVMNYMHWKHAAPSLLNFDISSPECYGKATVFRALMENAAYNTLGNLELICEAAGSFPQEVIFAGGASYSPTWCSILASVLGVPVKVPKVKESTALGAFICAAVGAGSFKSFDEATCSTTRTEAVYLPDENDHGVYREHYERWKQVYGTILSLSDSGVLRHMWKSPGE